MCTCARVNPKLKVLCRDISTLTCLEWGDSSLQLQLSRLADCLPNLSVYVFHSCSSEMEQSPPPEKVDSSYCLLAIARSIAKGLHPNMVYSDSDYLNNAKAELRKLLKQGSVDIATYTSEPPLPLHDACTSSLISPLHDACTSSLVSPLHDACTSSLISPLHDACTSSLISPLHDALALGPSSKKYI